MGVTMALQFVCRFSEIKLPLCLKGQREFMAGETKDGMLCNVCVVQLMLVVWVWRVDNDNTVHVLLSVQ
jgi:hypothetical protein